MEKLTIEHLAPYLPYKLQIMYFGKKRTMNCSQGSSTNWISLRAVIQRFDDNCKPILRNLSDLTKEIEVNGEKFVPLVELAKISESNEKFDKIKGVERIFIMDDTKTTGITDYRIDYYHDGELKSLGYSDKYYRFWKSNKYRNLSFTNQLQLFQKLYQWHFAINIPEHLYIDINTLKQ